MRQSEGHLLEKGQGHPNEKRSKSPQSDKVKVVKVIKGQDNHIETGSRSPYRVNVKVITMRQVIKK